MSNNVLEFYINGDSNDVLRFIPKKIVNAGYTGRNQEEVRKHIDELKAAGVPAPDTIPMYYLKSGLLLDIDGYCDVIDEDSTGEAEYVLLITKDEIYVAAGSDHTDRNLEITNIPKAKQMCPNFISKSVWKFNDVKDYWDDLMLRSWIGKNREQLYQETKLSAFMTPEELLDRVKVLLKDGLEEGIIIYSGTVGALVPGMPFSDVFEVEIMDEKFNRSLKCLYEIKLMNW